MNIFASFKNWTSLLAGMDSTCATKDEGRRRCSSKENTAASWWHCRKTAFIISWVATSSYGGYSARVVSCPWKKGLRWSSGSPTFWSVITPPLFVVSSRCSLSEEQTQRYEGLPPLENLKPHHFFPKWNDFPTSSCRAAIVTFIHSHAGLRSETIHRAGLRSTEVT